MNVNFEELQRVFAGVENGIIDPILSAAVSAYALKEATSTPDMEDDNIEVLNEYVRAIKAYGNVSKKAFYDAIVAVKKAYEPLKEAYYTVYQEYAATEYANKIQEDPREYAKLIIKITDSMQNKECSINHERFNELFNNYKIEGYGKI